MKSVVAITSELIDMALAAKELIGGISKQPLLKNSLGILFCDSELENHQALIEALKGQYDFDLIGCTTVATLNTQYGISEMTSCLMVLTSDDVDFHVALSETIDQANVEKVVEQTYYDAARKLSGEPKMLLTFPPHNLEIMFDIYTDTLSGLSGGVPVFGGLPGYNSPYGFNGVVYNDNVYRNKMLLVMLEGNVRPLFSIGIELSHVADENRVVTSSDKNTIYKVDNMTMVEYLSSIGFNPKLMAEDKTQILYVSNPLMLTQVGRGKDEYTLIRTMHSINLAEGSAVTIGLVPQGHHIAIGTLTRNDIKVSAEKGIQALLQKIKEQEAIDSSYEYSTIIATSCVGRYMVMTPHIEVEGNVFKELIPDKYAFIGYYGYGELGPTHMKDGVAVNTSQNESLTLCAF